MFEVVSDIALKAAHGFRHVAPPATSLKAKSAAAAITSATESPQCMLIVETFRLFHALQFRAEMCNAVNAGDPLI